MDMELYTIGHSTRSFTELAAILERYGIKTLADIRTLSHLRQEPPIRREELGGYRREGLGTRSPNRGWESEG